MDLDGIFSPCGALDSVLDSYSFRDSQLEMAKLIEKGFLDKRHIVVEAGTGTGKSFAYLVPAFLMVSDDKSKKVVIATSTTTLQKQLYDKDIPLVQQALGIELDVALLFGRNNYLCLRRYQDSYEARKLLSLDLDTPEARFDKWVASTESGAIQDAPSNVAYLMKDLRSDDKDCLGKSCPYRDKCFFYEARKRAQRAKIIVTNHHIVLFDARYRYENEEDFSSDCILPGYTHCIIDEAHHIEDEATEILSSNYNSDIALSELDDLTRKQARFGNMSILRYLSPYEKEDKNGVGKRIEDDVAHLRTLINTFDINLSALLSSSFNDKSILFTREFYSTNKMRISFGEGVAEELMRIAVALDTSYIESDEEPALDTIAKISMELASLSDTLRTWMRFSDFDSYIPYALEDPRSGKYTIRIAPMSTGPILDKVLLSNLESLLYCSATLSVNNDFSYFASISGLEGNKDLLKGIFLSPFDYGRSLLLLVPMDGMEYSKATSLDYNEYAIKATSDAISSSAGGALVLFTAKDMLSAVCSGVRERIGDDNRILSQCDEKEHRAKLLREFRDDVDSSLFATDSFWEGVDAPGNTLRLVIIEKLPFHVPTDPIDKARSDYIDSKKGGASFIKLTVPQASIKLKQGIGRLIRNEDDRGVVLILDKRIISKGYGRMMLESIPQGYIPEDTLLSNIPDKIERFLF